MKYRKKVLVTMLFFTPVLISQSPAQQKRYYSDPAKPKYNYRERIETIIRRFHNEVLQERNLEKLNTIVVDKTKEIDRLRAPYDAKDAAIQEMEDTVELIGFIRGILAQKKRARQMENTIEILPLLDPKDQQRLETIVNNFFKGTMYQLSLDQLIQKRNKALREIAVMDLSSDIKNPVVDLLRTFTNEINERTAKIK